jgi:regulator of replication initiation timing
LRGVGITRTIAGFLLWVGYTAFAGVGSVIGSLLQRRQQDPKAADIFGNFVRGFASFFGLQHGRSFLWLPLFKMLLLVVVLLIAIMGTTAIADVILRKFDSRWKKKAFTDGRGRGRPASSSSRLQGLFSLFASGSDRFSLFASNISRTDYVQLLASSPYLVLAAIAVFIIAALGLTEAFGSPDQANTSATLTTASIGAIFTLLSTSCCLLYATKVIEPRWNRFVNQDPDAVGFWNYLRVNWEFALIILSMIGALLVVTLAPLGEPNNYKAWGFVGLFMTLGSAGLAYGLMYRGVFRDYDVLYRRRQEYVTKMQEYTLKPTLSDVFESTEPEELNNSLLKYRRAIDYLDALRIGSELNTLEVNDSWNTSGFLNLWLVDLPEDSSATAESFLNIPDRYLKKLARLIRRFGARKRHVRNPPPGGWEVSPTETAAYDSYNQQINANSTRIGEIDKELQELNEKKARTTSILGTLRSDLSECENRKSAAKTDFVKKREEYEMQKKRYVTTFTEGFLTGRILYRYLTREPEFQP